MCLLQEEEKVPPFCPTCESLYPLTYKRCISQAVTEFECKQKEGEGAPTPYPYQVAVKKLKKEGWR